MKILITGHKGFVGRNFVKRLEQDGHEIFGVDLKDGNDCREWFKFHKGHYDLVIHLAAIVGGRMTIEGAPLSVASDLSIDAEFFNWVVETKPTNVVYFSSSAAYPIMYQTEDSQIDLEEEDIQLDSIHNPDLTYGWAKLTGEYLAQFVTESNMFIFRPFSGYGSDQDTDYPFPSFIDRGLKQEAQFDVWGDGEQVRDFIHIEDVVEAVLHHVAEGITGTFNLCTGVPTSFNELAEMVMNAAGYSAPINHIEAPVGVRYRVGDVHKSHKHYVPKITLQEGIERALKERQQLK